MPAGCDLIMPDGPRYMTATRRAEFEGGYSQRSSAGPNSLRMGRTITVMGPKAGIKEVSDFLARMAGVGAFYLRAPCEDEPVLYSAASWQVMNTGHDSARLTAELRQEFDIV